MIKSILKKVIRKTGITVHKTKYIPLGTDPYMDIHNHFKNQKLSCIFDVGANTGQTIHRIKSSIFNPFIYAFEPIKDTFAELHSKFRDDPSVHLENIGFGLEKGELTIGIAKNSLWNSFKNLPNSVSDNLNETVKVETIDNYVTEKKLKKINLLKIDVEGFEVEVLRGAQHALSTNQIDFIFCEVGINNADKHHTPFQEVLNLITPYNFKFVSFYDHSLINSDAHYANALFFNSNTLSFH